MNKNDRVVHHELGSGTIIDKRIHNHEFPYLVRFDFDLFNLKWCSGNELEKQKVKKLGGRQNVYK